MIKSFEKFKLYSNPDWAPILENCRVKYLQNKFSDENVYPDLKLEDLDFIDYYKTIYINEFWFETKSLFMEFIFNCFEPGDVIHILSYKKLTAVYDKGPNIIFTNRMVSKLLITEIDYTNLRYDGYIENLYLINNLYYKDCHVLGLVEELDMVELASRIESINQDLRSRKFDSSKFIFMDKELVIERDDSLYTISPTIRLY